jgi:4a-hydroxytetrahydrobiopterin dehydratase
MRISDEEIIPLAMERCRACRGMIAPLSAGEAEILLRRLPAGWRIDNKGHIVKEFFFKNFKEALNFVDEIGALSERERHHPVLHLSWGLVRVVLWTAKIGGLQRSDFILAAKIEEVGNQQPAGRSQKKEGL